jgi:hypothetical protein
MNRATPFFKSSNTLPVSTAKNPATEFGRSLKLKRPAATGEPFTHDDIENILNQVAGAYYLFFRTLCRVSCRVGEALGGIGTTYI